MKKDSIGNKYSQELYAKTKFYQKRYGFKLESLDGDTHNNEADAFKHTYMTWHLSWYYGDQKAKELGDMHENETPSAPLGERNMDLWNNAMGREIAFDMKFR